MTHEEVCRLLSTIAALARGGVLGGGCTAVEGEAGTTVAIREEKGKRIALVVHVTEEGEVLAGSAVLEALPRGAAGLRAPLALIPAPSGRAGRGRRRGRKRT
jgi:hypothetical protein